MTCRALFVITLLFILGTFLPGCIDEPLVPPNGRDGLTAATRLDAVDSAAESTLPALRLLSVIGRDVHPDGTSELWLYRYVDTGFPEKSYWFHADVAGVAFDSITPTGLGGARISHQWIDSDEALRIAERAGGRLAREQDPSCTITASLGEPVVPDPQTTWWIGYRSTSGEMRFWISINATPEPVVVFDTDPH